MDAKQYVIVTVVVSICTAAFLIGTIFQVGVIHESDNKVRTARIAGCNSLSDQTAKALCLREVKV